MAEDAEAGTICQAFQRLIGKLIPESNWPIYCVPYSTIWPDLRHPYFIGMHNVTSYWQIKKFLPRDVGPGPVLEVLDFLTPTERLDTATQIQMVLRARGEPDSIEEVLSCIPEIRGVDSVCRILVHELGHALVAIANGQFAEWAEIFEDASDRLLATIQRSRHRGLEQTRTLAEPPAPQIDSHGATFTRAVAMIDSRLRGLGVQSQMHDVAGCRFNQPIYDDCFAALAADRGSQCNFQQLLNSPLPRAFKVLLRSKP